MLVQILEYFIYATKYSEKRWKDMLQKNLSPLYHGLKKDKVIDVKPSPKNNPFSYIGVKIAFMIWEPCGWRNNSRWRVFQNSKFTLFYDFIILIIKLAVGA